MTKLERARSALGNVRVSEAALGIFAIGLGVAVAITASGYRDGSTYDSLGPGLFPLLIAAGLILSGLPILRGAFGQDTAAVAGEQIDWIPVALIVCGLVATIALLLLVGWIPIITAVFALGARAFGSRRTRIDLALGLLFSILTFVIFNYGLGLQLPAGWLVSRFLT